VSLLPPRLPAKSHDAVLLPILLLIADTHTPSGSRRAAIQPRRDDIYDQPRLCYSPASSSCESMHSNREKLTLEADSSPDKSLMPATSIQFRKLRIASDSPLIPEPHMQRSTSSLKRPAVDEPVDRECNAAESPREDVAHRNSYQRRSSYPSPPPHHNTGRPDTDSSSDVSPTSASLRFARPEIILNTPKPFENSKLAVNSSLPTHRSKAALIYEPEILGFLHDTAVTFFPDNQSAYDIMSHDYAKRNHFEIISSTKGKLQTARGAMVNTLGTVSRPIRFAKESETYMREFHVLPKCVHDIILGSHFLRLTQTFTKFRHRIVNKLRGLSSRRRVCFTGSSQQMLAGWANSQSALALPDTGSDICLVSAQYARERGYRVDTDPRHRQLLEFVDGSTAETLGRVEGFQWEFDKSDIQLHNPEIHVLEGLQTDLLLGYDFLMHTDAFSTHEELFVDIEPHDEHADEMFGWLACAIKLVTFSKVWKAPAKLGLKSRNPSAGKF
jgi:hypothetical protein